MNFFLKKIIIFLVIYFFIHSLAVVYFFVIKTEAKTVYDFLYQYQVQKIKSTTDVETVFIGDSSLGNSIDSKLFSNITKSKSINIGLTGMYGYAGSFNMLKKAISNQTKLKNVVIMQTLDMQMRKISLQGYAYTMTDYSDFENLSLNHKLKVLYSFTKIRQFLFALLEDIIIKKKINVSVLNNDYIKQGNKKEFNNDVSAFNPRKIKLEKNFFLRKIVTLCKNKKLNLIYIYGPLHDKQVECSQKYIQISNEKINLTGVFLIEDVIAVESNDLGDSSDHIKPEMKQKYTTVYVDILKQYLK